MAYDLPKQVWTHWDSDTLPDICRLCLERTRKILPDWQVNFLTTADFLKLCTPPAEFSDLSNAAKSDYIRLWLLREYGGVWMDISILLNESLNEMYNDAVRIKAECAGFYLERYTTNRQYPVFESWFIMAPKESRFIRAWFDEYHRAITVGCYNYKKLARGEGVETHKLFTSEMDTYLTIHLCYQVVIQRRMRDAVILYKKAEDTMYRVHDMCNFDFDCMRTEFKKSHVKDIPYIKLRGCDRDLFPISYFTETTIVEWIVAALCVTAVVGVIAWPSLKKRLRV